MKSRLIALVESASMLALGLLVVGYAARDKLKYFVNLTYTDLIVVGGVALLVLGGIYAVTAFATDAHEDPDESGESHHHGHDHHAHDHARHNHVGHNHGHDHDVGPWVRLRQAGWLLIPVILAAVFAPKPLSSATAVARGISNDLPTALQDHRGFRRSENRTLYDWVMALNLDPEPDHYKKDKVNVEGFVMRAPGTPPDQFVVAKFVISCCAADARPVGIPVRYAGAPMKDGAWVRVNGRIVEGHAKGERVALVQADTLTPIPQPAEPYLN